MAKKGAGKKEAKLIAPLAHKPAVETETKIEAVKAEEGKVEAVKTEEAKAEEGKAEAAKTEEVKAEEAKTEKEKEAKKETKKKTTKKADPKAAVIIEYGGRQIVAKEVLKSATKAFKKLKKDVTIKTIEIYVKPEEGVAYYVVNGEGSDEYKVEL